eukprot:13240324-Alexandrium_andersonii.AAC.1
MCIRDSMRAAAQRFRRALPALALRGEGSAGTRGDGGRCVAEEESLKLRQACFGPRPFRLAQRRPV